ncbi:MAG: hypothetical protein ABIH01_04420 [Candidatus Omnitrophota bacterium]
MAQPKRYVSKQLGKLLVERGVINPEQLQEALKIQGQTGGLIGNILVARGYSSEEAIAQALTTQYGFPYLPLNNYEIDGPVIRLVPEYVAKQYCLIPVDRIGSSLTIAVADPLNVEAIEDIEFMTRLKVQVFISTASQIKEAITRYYG